MSKLMFEISSPERRTVRIPSLDVPQTSFDSKYRRANRPRLPEVAEVDLVRHYIGLSKMAHGVDNGFYPLGSCTMKYNPRINEDVAKLFANIHPLQPIHTIQGCLKLMDQLQKALCEITGMDAITLQPAAGAHGEFTGLQLIKAYHTHHHDEKRINCIIPDSAHGTNPASAGMVGYKVVSVSSNAQGGVDIDQLRSLCNEETAALMLTNPNTLGISDPNIEEITKIVHDAGGLVYYDGANLNAIMGIARPKDMGFDVVHLNLHKTFSTPHGAGGPGSGPVGCVSKLEPFLPKPIVSFSKNCYDLEMNRELSIGRMKSFYGNFLVCVKAYNYIIMLGKDGLKEVSQNAVLNSNYMMEKLKGMYDVPYQSCLHEFVMSLESIKENYGISAKDVSKALLDYGIHPPTMYFPLIVHEALMVEPNETESKETLDEAIATFTEIYEHILHDPEKIMNAPISTPVGRIDEVLAARHPVLRHKF